MFWRVVVLLSLFDLLIVLSDTGSKLSLSATVVGTACIRDRAMSEPELFSWESEVEEQASGPSRIDVDGYRTSSPDSDSEEEETLSSEEESMEATFVKKRNGQ